MAKTVFTKPKGRNTKKKTAKKGKRPSRAPKKVKAADVPEVEIEAPPKKDRRRRLHRPTPQVENRGGLGKKESQAYGATVAQDDWRNNLRDIAQVLPHQNFVPLDLKGINWERRLAAKKDPLYDLRVYHPKVFYLNWSSAQKALVSDIETRMEEGGKKAFGMPRGTGKTAICRGMINRAIKFGLRKFLFFIGSKEPKAKQTLTFIRTYWYRSQEMRQDFPELAYPIYRIEGRSSQGVHGQNYKGERTHLTWATDQLQFPSMLFDEEDVADYLKHDPDSMIYLPDHGINIEKFMSVAAGTILRVAGIDGSIRGEAEIHPILLNQPRPDLVLLDDVQKDQRADSPKACEDLITLIESAIDYLAAPDVTQATLMPCTVIREGDVSDRYLNPQEKHEWNGSRYGIIEKYPDGINDTDILDEIDGKENPQGAHWLEYKEIREESYQKHSNLKLANEYYKTHREVMDEGFEVSWEERYKQDSKNDDVNEVSAIQSAMNWRFKDLISFLSEGQNRPRGKGAESGILLTPAEVAEHFTEIPRFEISTQWTKIVAFIDVQDEILFYTVLAFDMDFNGQFIDYNTFPRVSATYFKKGQLGGWCLLSRLYYKDNPTEKPQRKNTGDKMRAPYEGKIYNALKHCVGALLKQTYVKNDQHQSEVPISAIAIDSRWGKSSETVKRFVRELKNPRVITYSGQAFQPSHKQLEEYDLTAGWLFEHQQFPHVKESKWVLKPGKDGGQYILADVNRLKSFLMKRLAIPLGGKGSISLFKPDLPNGHRMYSMHVAGSEYPEPITARGITKDCWMERPEMKGENDYLDTSVGCICLASICGASIKSEAHEQVYKQRKRTLRDHYNNRTVHR